MKVKKTFQDIFIINPDGSIEPRILVRIGGVQFGPGLRFGRGVVFGGIDMYQYIGHDLEVDEENGIAVITGIY